ncbi:hypothetical protein EYF80_027683 [Liparis tanakae]|uniref:Uncharacterized protein n=1 Tax=Liparis tanakae TaxID=230148 RepID=A0A4Z2H907_9TELE|nr:hypothetical protein EYF80_027683 [Liparis tanakae]
MDRRRRLSSSLKQLIRVLFTRLEPLKRKRAAGLVHEVWMTHDNDIDSSIAEDTGDVLCMRGLWVDEHEMRIQGVCAHRARGRRPQGQGEAASGPGGGGLRAAFNLKGEDRTAEITLAAIESLSIRPWSPENL